MRGDAFSAPAEVLGFKVTIDEIKKDRIFFKLEFEYPERVSTGFRSDVMTARVLDEAFFCSTDSPMSISENTLIVSVLPRILSGTFVEVFLESVESSIEQTTQTMMTGQLVMTIVLAVSLKQLWNLLNVMQVLAITREFT